MMTFTLHWQQPKLQAVPDDRTLAQQRQGLSGNQQKKQGIHPSQINYAQQNNQKRLDGQVYLGLFNETEVRNAIQRAQGKFQDPGVTQLLLDAIGTAQQITIDQGTHQDEDLASGGFMLHFDARRPDGKCFHLYVGQNPDGTLKIIEISYMNGQTKVQDHPRA
ncbi:MAG: hypothetical protein WD009_01315 [Phycisphaeraceae bacterium]